ncbi:hypothetical protein CRENPOLYSF2_3780003 [Crenothrix polyspora]|uniref:Uncharacterized protein n=1 Tax=Crenothrix polyspora TaxID=360316 RepID=A0A1R4HD39_9GAMM|nr:hypothetical protein CRENPOLYSF2_3780003 [Crenothrix polyspora]
MNGKGDFYPAIALTLSYPQTHISLNTWFQAADAVVGFVTAVYVCVVSCPSTNFSAFCTPE